MQVHRAVLAVLAGHVFPRPPWMLRWRLALFSVFVKLNHWLPLVPRQRSFSLLAEPRVGAEPGEQADRAPRAARPPVLSPATPALAASRQWHPST
jgi:hypothetical protein